MNFLKLIKQTVDKPQHTNGLSYEWIKITTRLKSFFISTHACREVAWNAHISNIVSSKLSLFWYLDFYRTHCLHKIVHIIFERWPIENLMSKHALNNGINTITLICCYRACFKSFFGKIPMYNFFIHYQEQHKIDSLRMFSKCCYKVIIIFMLITLKV